MARARHSANELALRLGLLALAFFLGTRLREPGRPAHEADVDPPASQPLYVEARPRHTLRAQRGSITLRRLASLTAFAVLFAGGAALSAGAGDVVVDVVEGAVSTEESTVSEATTESAAPAPEEAPAEAPAPEEAPTPAETGTSGDPTTEQDPAESAPAPQAPVPTETPGSAEEPASEAGGPATGQPGPAPKGEPAPAAAVVAGDSLFSSKEPEPMRAPELEAPLGYATIWLHRVLPDPTPPARRLTPAFAASLRTTARAYGVGWDVILAVLRARGYDGPAPAGPVRLARLAERLAAAGARYDRRGAALAIGGTELFADRVIALSRYNRAVGLRALVTGLEAAKGAMARAVLGDERVNIYPGGRFDIASGRVDVRVLVLVRYLRVAFGRVTVSSLRSGHRFYARPGVPSAHVYGLAVDISALGRVPVVGNQYVGSVVERAVEAILLLPSELQPQQVISLLGLGARSFAQADHYDHIHVGF